MKNWTSWNYKFLNPDSIIIKEQLVQSLVWKGDPKFVNMANPRKFSEKIALHTQKQAEETAAFEQILRDVQAATQNTATAPLQVQQVF